MRDGQAQHSGAEQVSVHWMDWVACPEDPALRELSWHFNGEMERGWYRGICAVAIPSRIVWRHIIRDFFYSDDRLLSMLPQAVN